MALHSTTQKDYKSNSLRHIEAAQPPRKSKVVLSSPLCRSLLLSLSVCGGFVGPLSSSYRRRFWMGFVSRMWGIVSSFRAEPTVCDRLHRLGVTSCIKYDGRLLALCSTCSICGFGVCCLLSQQNLTRTCVSPFALYRSTPSPQNHHHAYRSIFHLLHRRHGISSSL